VAARSKALVCAS